MGEHEQVNVFDPRWTGQGGDPPLIGRTARVGAAAGCERLGATLYEIEAGNNASPYHFHHANEELIVVLAGRPSVRTPDGTSELRPGDVFACPAGSSGAHQVQNHAQELARVLVLSTMIYPDVAELLDSDKVMVMSAPPGAVGRMAAAFQRTSAVDRLAGEIDDN